MDDFRRCFATWEKAGRTTNTESEMIKKFFLFFSIENTSTILRKIGKVIFQRNFSLLESIKKKVFAPVNNPCSVSRETLDLDTNL